MIAACLTAMKSEKGQGKQQKRLRRLYKAARVVEAVQRKG